MSTRALAWTTLVLIYYASVWFSFEVGRTSESVYSMSAYQREMDARIELDLLTVRLNNSEVTRCLLR